MTEPFINPNALTIDQAARLLGMGDETIRCGLLGPRAWAQGQDGPETHGQDARATSTRACKLPYAVSGKSVAVLVCSMPSGIAGQCYELT